VIREWGDLDARARGLSTRLLDRAALLALARAAELSALGRALPAGVRPPTAARDPTPIEIERAIRTDAARQLALLARWAGRRRQALAVVFEEEDLRSVRALLRGAAGPLPPERRLAGVIPTRSLPEPVLADAAEAESPRAALERLASWGQPDAASIIGAAVGVAPDLFRVEALLARGFAGRCVEAARRGGRGLRAYAAQVVDLENAWSALLARRFGFDVPASEVFIEGGRALDRDGFLRAAAADDLLERRRLVAEAFAGTALAAPFDELATPQTRLEAAVLRARIDEQRRAGRLDPLGPGPLLEFALRVRAQVLDVQVVAWGVALEAPPDLMAAELVGP
jgi:vacuolar-type H+-ATPase subunit C/Vma6